MGLKKFRKIRAQDEEYVNVSVVCNNYDRINRENREFNNNMKLGIYEKSAISTEPSPSLVRNRLKQGKCCNCGKNNPCKNIQILCPECMEQAMLCNKL